MEALVGNTIARLFADKGYRGHNAPPDYKLRIFISGQKRGVTPKIKREFADFRPLPSPILVSMSVPAFLGVVFGPLSPHLEIPFPAVGRTVYVKANLFEVENTDPDIPISSGIRKPTE